MYLIQLLLPLYDNHHQCFSQDSFDYVRHELTEKFGGVTAFSRSPAEGIWKENGKAEEKANRDEIIIFEVMADELDRKWWREYRTDLEKRFKQEKLIIRSSEFEQL
jgi:hypothetical protein